MDVAKVYLERRQLCGLLASGQLPGHLRDADGAVVVQTGALSILQVLLGAAVNPLSCQCRVVKPDGTNSSCWVAIAASLSAWRIMAQQAPCRLFLDV